MSNVLVFEDNLIWSARLKKSLAGLGHEATVFTEVPAVIPDAQAAIVNLGSPKIDAAKLVALLRAQGIYVIAHAGHKETELRRFGQDLGCDRIASNSELTFKLADLLSAAAR